MGHNDNRRGISKLDVTNIGYSSSTDLGLATRATVSPTQSVFHGGAAEQPERKKTVARHWSRKISLNTSKLLPTKITSLILTPSGHKNLS